MNFSARCLNFELILRSSVHLAVFGSRHAFLLGSQRFGKYPSLLPPSLTTTRAYRTFPFVFSQLFLAGKGDGSFFAPSSPRSFSSLTSSSYCIYRKHPILRVLSIGRQPLPSLRARIRSRSTRNEFPPSTSSRDVRERGCSSFQAQW